MIQVDVVALDQRYVFGDGGAETQNFLVLLLPNGHEVRAAIDLQTAKQFLVLDMSSKSNGRPAPGEPAEPQETMEESPVPERPAINLTGLRLPQDPMDTAISEAETLSWLELPDEVLSPALKAAFTHLEAPARMTPSGIRTMQRDILDRFGPEEWNEVLGPQWNEHMTAAPPAPAAPPRRPPINQLQWTDGAPMISSTTRSRTVPTTDLGYPAPNDGTVDPGEVVGGVEADEDGVGSL